MTDVCVCVCVCGASDWGARWEGGGREAQTSLELTQPPTSPGLSYDVNCVCVCVWGGGGVRACVRACVIETLTRTHIPPPPPPG